MPVVPIDRDELIGCFRAAARRLTDALRSTRDPTTTAVGHWTIGDVAVHVAHTFERNLEGAQGRGFPGETIHDISAYNEAYLGSRPDRDIEAAADVIDELCDRVAAAVAERDIDDPVPWFGDLPVPVGSIPGILISECELHGFDVASAEGNPWKIPPRHANLVFDTSIPLLPYFVNRDALPDRDVCFDMRMRGGSRVHLVFSGGELSVEVPRRRRVDCHISATPSSFLLVSYGRVGRWLPVLKGEVVSWGRRPLLALKLPQYLNTP